MKYPKLHKVRFRGFDQLARMIATYLMMYGEVELRFGDGTRLVCDRDLGRCTWWHDHAYNYPDKQREYPRDWYKYILGVLKRKRNLREVIVTEYGEERHIIEIVG